MSKAELMDHLSMHRYEAITENLTGRLESLPLIHAGFKYAFDHLDLEALNTFLEIRIPRDRVFRPQFYPQCVIHDSQGLTLTQNLWGSFLDSAEQHQSFKDPRFMDLATRLSQVKELNINHWISIPATQYHNEVQLHHLIYNRPTKDIVHRLIDLNHSPLLQSFMTLGLKLENRPNNSHHDPLFYALSQGRGTMAQKIMELNSSLVSSQKLYTHLVLPDSQTPQSGQASGFLTVDGEKALHIALKLDGLHRCSKANWNPVAHHPLNDIYRLKLWMTLRALLVEGSRSGTKVIQSMASGQVQREGILKSIGSSALSLLGVEDSSSERYAEAYWLALKTKVNMPTFDFYKGVQKHLIDADASLFLANFVKLKSSSKIDALLDVWSLAYFAYWNKSNPDGVDASSRNASYWTLFERGLSTLTEEEINQPTSLNDLPLLVIAAALGQVDVCRSLLQNKAHLNPDPNRAHPSAIAMACRYNHPTLVQALLKANVDLWEGFDPQQTFPPHRPWAIHEALLSNPPLAARLIHYDASCLDQVNQTGLDAMSLMEQKGIDFKALLQEQETQRAARMDQKKRLLELSASLSDASSSVNTPSSSLLLESSSGTGNHQDQGGPQGLNGAPEINSLETADLFSSDNPLHLAEKLADKPLFSKTNSDEGTHLEDSPAKPHHSRRLNF